VDFSEGGWKKPVGYSAAAAGVLVGAFGTYELFHGRSQISQVDSSAGARGGAYTQAEMSTIGSARSSEKAGAALMIVGAALVAAGAVFVFAF
jgi:hypothetical protein